MYITILDYDSVQVYTYKLTDEQYEMDGYELFATLPHNFDNCQYMYHANHYYSLI